jgi:hypothetical protein
MRKEDEAPVEALWVSPEGEEIPVIEHLIEISQHPDRFGLTYREVHGISIANLRDIAVELIKKGWTRFRYLSCLWNFEVDSVRMRIGVIENILVRQRAFPHETVVVSQAKPKRDYQGNVAQFYDRTMFGRYELGRNPWRVT